MGGGGQIPQRLRMKRNNDKVEKNFKIVLGNFILNLPKRVERKLH